jgi:hypothetical protein
MPVALGGHIVIEEPELHARTSADDIPHIAFVEAEDVS